MNILEEIVEKKQSEVAVRKRERGISSLNSQEHFSRTTNPLSAAFGRELSFGIIAEIKRASPSGGMFAPHIQPARLASEYERCGAAGISVLTDESFFHGSLGDLEAVRGCVSAPILSKDFIIDEYQLFESKAYGADAILLIASILDRFQLLDFASAARELNLDILVELYEAEEINKLHFGEINFVGINNRDLRTFKVDLAHTLDIKRRLPENVVVISESGIRSKRDIDYLRNSGISGALVGECLAKAESPGKMLQELLGSDQHASAR